MDTAFSHPAVGQRTSGTVWAGRVVTALPVMFLTFDTVIKLLNLDPVVQSLRALGWPDTFGPVIGVIELVCLVTYLFPRTAVLGAVLFTGYLGGATATHLRLNDPLFTHVLFAGYVGALLWLGLFLREPRLRAFLPLRTA
jgi:hypothetical protein